MLVIAATLLVGGCGSAAAVSAAASTSSTSTTILVAEDAPSLPVTVTDDTGAEVTITDVSRIIPVNGDIAEVVYALGLGDNVVATDISATYPDAADKSPKIGYQRALAAETILAFEPTVIIADDLAGPPEVLDQLRSTGIPIIVIDRERTIDGPIDKVARVAEALGVPARGAALAATMRTEIAAAEAHADEAVADSGRPRVLALYLRGSNVQFAFGEGSGVDVLIEAAGGIDVGTESGIVDTQELTAEAIVKAAPDIIVVTTTGLESVGGLDGLFQLGGLSQTPAAAGRRVVAMEDQYLYGLGPRVGQLLGELADAFHADPASGLAPTTSAVGP